MLWSFHITNCCTMWKLWVRLAFNLSTPVKKHCCLKGSPNKSNWNQGKSHIAILKSLTVELFACSMAESILNEVIIITMKLCTASLHFFFTKAKDLKSQTENWI